MSDEQVTDHPDTDRPDVGTVAEETAKLLGALSDWAKEHGGGAGTAAGAAAGAAASSAAAAFDELNAHFATGGEDCKYCPICRVVHVVRECSPEVRTHLALAAANLAQAAAAIMASAVPDEARQARREPVEKIDLDNAPEGAAADDFGPGSDEWDSPENPFSGPFG